MFQAIVALPLHSVSMKDVIYLLFHLLTTIAKLIRSGGSRSVIAENLLLKQQLIIHSRSRQRAPNLTTRDRALLGFWSLFLNSRRIARAAIIIKPSTLLYALGFCVFNDLTCQYRLGFCEEKFQAAQSGETLVLEIDWVIGMAVHFASERSRAPGAGDRKGDPRRLYVDIKILTRRIKARARPLTATVVCRKYESITG